MENNDLEKGPICYRCTHRRDLPGDCHSGCENSKARVTGHPHGKKMGWFYWPWNFDPVWLESCDGFQEKEKSANA